MDIHFIFTSSSGGDSGGGGGGRNGNGNNISGTSTNINAQIPASQILLRILNLQNRLSQEDTHFLPFVQHVRNCKGRLENLDKEVVKGMKKTNEMVREMSKEMEYMEEDDKVNDLLKGVIQQNSTLSTALKQLDPMIKSYIQSIKDLSDYVLPPTEELFKKKALSFITKTEKIPLSKKNTCAICLDNTADVIIKRECHLKAKKPSIPVQSPSIYSRDINNPFNINSFMQSVNNQTSNTTSSSNRPNSTNLNNTHSSNSSSGSNNNASTQRKNVVCEKAFCNCGPTMCQECLIKHYWVSSSNGLKSFSKCVCCRAEFCLTDIRNVEYYDDNEKKEKDGETIKTNNNTTTTTTTTSSSNTSKKRKESTIDEPTQKKYKPEGKSKSSTNRSNSSEYIFLTDKLNSSNVNNKNKNGGNENEDLKEYKDSKDDESEEDNEDDNNNNTINSNQKNEWSFKKLIQFWK